MRAPSAHERGLVLRQDVHEATASFRYAVRVAIWAKVRNQAIRDQEADKRDLLLFEAVKPKRSLSRNHVKSREARRNLCYYVVTN